VSASGFEIGCDGPSVMLVGFDGSDTSWRALHYALGLARRQHSEVIVVHAEKSSPIPDSITTAIVEEANEAWTEQLRQEVLRVAAHHPHVCVSFIVGFGDPVRVLHEQATRRRADAIFLGASRRWGYRLAGSIAARAVRTIKTPVTVVP